MDIRKYNEIAWDNEVQKENVWTIPVTTEEVNKAKGGEYTLLLTPIKHVPFEWVGNVKGKNVLCLASGGGQQGPIFSALGANVVVFDNSKEQLSKDSMVAKRDNLDIKVEQGDMRDLSRFEDNTFGLIFHPVSNLFVDEIQSVWDECYRVLKVGGNLIAGFVNPLMYLFDYQEWENGNLVVKNNIPYSDIEQLPKEVLEDFIKNNQPLEHGHSLESQIGGQIKAGFAINGFYEDKALGEVLCSYIDTYIATKAIKI